MKEERADYRDGETELSGLFIFNDDLHGDRPGLLVVHGGAGLDDHTRERARQFAELGLVAFACDMYGTGVMGDRARVMSTVTALRDDPASLVRRTRAGLDVLASHSQVSGKPCAVGYCFGGMTALALARSGADIAGAISVHGTLASTSPAQPGSIKAKILVCHGALDPFVPPSQVIAFMEEMDGAGADWQLVVYGGAMHGFTHREGPATQGVAYDPAADARSFEAITAFLTEVFGQPLPVR
jgi:dienelactone hydrolase